MRKLLFIILCCLVSVSFAAKEVSLKEKIGQMLIVGFKGSEIKKDDAIVKAILGKQIGGVVLYDYDVETKSFDHNIKNPTQLKRLTSRLQSYSDVAESLPLLISIDYEGGRVNRLKEEYGFPKTLSAAEVSKLNSQEAFSYADMMAHVLEDNGINFNFAPVLDVNVDPDSPAIGRLGRSFSENPYKVALYAGIFARAFNNHGILCSYKHFPGHGSANGDTHQGFVDVTNTWRKEELQPYKILFQEKYSCPIVMSAHVVHYGLDTNGYPATLSKAILTNLLRHQLGFQGVVVTDDMQMRAIVDHYGLRAALRLTINAGSDLIMFANQQIKQQDPAELIEFIYEDVKRGEISRGRIEEAYQRIVNLKKRLHHS